MKEIIVELSIKLKKEGGNYALEVVKQGDMSDFALLGEILSKSNNKASTGGGFQHWLNILKKTNERT